MDLKKFLGDIKIKGVELWVEGNNLRYRSPKGVLTKAKLSEIKQNKQDILQFLKKGDYISKSYRLSLGQETLYLTHNLAPESPIYNLFLAIRIFSKFNVKAMQKSLQALVERHACLRTLFFHQENDELMQNVYGYKDAYFESIDGSAWNENKLKRQVKAVYERPFILEKGPLMRAHLFTRSESDHVLLFTFHHIISDGWSLWMIIDELQKLYSAQKTGSKTSLPSILSSYADFVQWQSEMLNSSRGESLWNYWKNQLSGDLPVITLPIDHPRPVMQTFNGATYSFELDEELSEKIKNLAKAEGVTLFMLLLAAYEVLLYRYTGQEDILVSSATTGRTNRKFANVMGYFINLIVLRADFASNLTFKKFLNHTRETVLGAIKNQDYPFASLVKKLQIKRDSSYSPLVQTGFILQRPLQFSTLVDDAEKRINWGGA